MNKTLGFVGTGNMGQAMIKGILNAGLLNPSQIMVSDLDTAKLEYMNNSYGVKTTTDSKLVAEQSDIIILAVKPDIYGVVMESIKDKVTIHKMIVTIAAGKTIEDIENILGGNVKVIRTMPNTPALVGEGMTALCPNKNISDEELEQVKSIFESFGKTELINEKLFNAVTGISGSSPAFVFMFIESMADSGVLAGMTRVGAYKFAAQTVLGSAKMVLETGKHPGELKDMVCSPGGTTIEGVAALEIAGFRASVIKGVSAAIEKSSDMTK